MANDTEERTLVDDDYERLPNEPDTDEDDETKQLIAEPEDPTLQVTGFPYAPEEEVGLEISQVEVVGPPAYGSPDPTTTAGRLVPLRDHPLTAENLGEDHRAAISADYAADLEDATATLGEE